MNPDTTTTEREIAALKRTAAQLDTLGSRGLGAAVALPADIREAFEYRRDSADRRRDEMRVKLARAETGDLANPLAPPVKPSAPAPARGQKLAARATSGRGNDDAMKLVNRYLAKRSSPRFQAALRTHLRGALR